MYVCVCVCVCVCVYIHIYIYILCASLSGWVPVSLACLGNLLVRESVKRGAKQPQHLRAVATCAHARTCARTHTLAPSLLPPASSPPSLAEWYTTMTLSQKEVHDDDLDLVSGGTH